MREHFSKPVLYVVVLLILIANTINIGADIGAMAAAANLLFPLPFVVFPLIFSALILTLEIFLSYKVYARILKWLTLALLAYPLTVFIVAEPRPTILRATFLPHIELNFPFLFVITGVLGTTISPYMFFWQASQETEEEREAHLIGKDGRPRINWGFIRCYPDIAFLKKGRGIRLPPFESMEDCDDNIFSWERFFLIIAYT